MVFHQTDRVVAVHDIRGMFKGDIRRGTPGVVIGHCGSDIPTYRVRFTITPGRTAVLDDLTDDDLAQVLPPRHLQPRVTTESPMTLQALSAVHATHDIHRGRHTIVKQGSPGVIVDSHPSWTNTTYTVEFTRAGKKHRKPIVTLVGLTEGDVEPD